MLGILNAGMLATFQWLLPPAHLGTYLGTMLAVVMGPIPLARGQSISQL